MSTDFAFGRGRSWLYGALTRSFFGDPKTATLKRN